MSAKSITLYEDAIRAIDITAHKGQATVSIAIQENGEISITHVCDGLQTDFTIPDTSLGDVALDWVGLSRKAK